MDVVTPFSYQTIRVKFFLCINDQLKMRKKKKRKEKIKGPFCSRRRMVPWRSGLFGMFVNEK